MTDDNSEVEFEYEDCSVCMEKPNNLTAFTTPCNHTFHKACLENWFAICRDGNREQSCPLCRRELNDVLNEMEDGARETYMEYADTLGVRIAYERQKILFASNLIETLMASPVQRLTGVDITGSSRRIERGIDHSLSQGEDLFAMGSDANRGKSLFAILGIVAISIFGAIFSNRSSRDD